MNCHFKKIAHTKPAFSLIEVVTSLIILALITSSVLVVINRCMASAADSALRMQAFEVARENMERLLASDSVSETVEYGTSDRYPQIQWRTTVEAFPEPITKQMWIRAVCSADYSDAEDETQTVELTHWLTNLTKEQLLQMIKQKEKGSEPMVSRVSYKGQSFAVTFEDGLLTIAEQEFTFSDEFLEQYKNEDEIDLEKLATDVLEGLDEQEYKKLIALSNKQLTAEQAEPDKPKGLDESEESAEPELPEPKQPGCGSLPEEPTMEEIMWYIRNCM